MPDFIAWAATSAVIPAAAAGGFVAGSLAGSFLNVVAHRAPRRETVIFGRSRCPACGATIRSIDNVPVLGWIALGGRCRDCRSPISSRYPLVEAGCGALAACLAAAEAAAGDRPAVAVVAWLGRTLVALTLVAWALLAARGHVVSRVTIGVATLAALLAAVFVPPLAPLSVACADAPCAGAWPDRAAAAVVGLVTGWLCGAASGGQAPAACGLVGAALGWQAALLAAAATGAARILWRHNAAAVTAAAVTAVVCWHPVVWAWAGICRAAGAG